MQNNFSQSSDENFKIDTEMVVGGVKVNYYFHCKTQLWLFSHFITQEQESELVILGKILEENVFKEIKRKNVMIDQKISIDFVKRKNELVVFDIKKSSKFKEAHYYQILYYLWYLKNIKLIENVVGIISYPKERRRIEIKLNQDKEKEILEIVKNINKIVSLPTPPKPKYKKYCRKCSYFEFCFSE